MNVNVIEKGIGAIGMMIGGGGRAREIETAIEMIEDEDRERDHRLTPPPERGATAATSLVISRVTALTHLI